MSDSNYLRDKVPEPDEQAELNSVLIKHGQIREVVVSFYTEIAQDDLLSKAFSNVEDWPQHFEIMTNFWWVRMGRASYIYYPYNPIKKHFENGFSAELLSRWLDLFKKSLAKHLNQEQMNAWFLLAEAIGNNLLSKNNEVIRMLNSR